MLQLSQMSHLICPVTCESVFGIKGSYRMVSDTYLGGVELGQNDPG